MDSPGNPVEAVLGGWEAPLSDAAMPACCRRRDWLDAAKCIWMYLDFNSIFNEW